MTATPAAPLLVCVRVIWDHQAPPLRLAFHALHIGPEPGHPFGRRGLALSAAWRQLSTPEAVGMVTLDGDVIVDPADVSAMFAAIVTEPDAVWTAPVRLWPISTHRPDWVWGHGRGTEPSQDEHPEPDWFSFGFTYLPRALIASCQRAGLDAWTYPGVDRRVSARARALSIPVRVAKDCVPKHINY